MLAVGLMAIGLDWCRWTIFYYPMTRILPRTSREPGKYMGFKTLVNIFHEIKALTSREFLIDTGTRPTTTIGGTSMDHDNYTNIVVVEPDKTVHIVQIEAVTEKVFGEENLCLDVSPERRLFARTILKEKLLSEPFGEWRGHCWFRNPSPQHMRRILSVEQRR